MDRPRAQNVGTRLGFADRARVERRATVLAERLLALAAALGGLDIDARRAGEDAKRPRRGADEHAECRAREDLAVGAVAHAGGRWIDLGLVADRAAVTGTRDLHRHPLESSTFIAPGAAARSIAAVPRSSDMVSLT